VGLPATSSANPRTVLVVEDEREVCELACEFLTASGYRVLTAQDGWEALETAKRLGKSIQAVLADMIMPKMGTGYLEQSDANGALPKVPSSCKSLFRAKLWSRKLLRL